ncbi:hypothetical protein GCM10008910_04120 [Faecalicatena orotica]|uniref:Uncharacterized protein n=1 Tax=Faecalicatena orotica TaxID=1544 RepID=A0A2Y9C9U4_9FIRM|nr:hypothetical protein [Faecalicatena orotica]PWJ30917.1 hypothetical protein A8806_103325 [Faecalicatena orotica]SSA55079.1 hypothetical protein SAMN05216536_103325 [Faecalicatena orotica]
MARRPKSLEEQISLAVTKRDKAKLLLEECEKEIHSINQQIEDRELNNKGADLSVPLLYTKYSGTN